MRKTMRTAEVIAVGTDPLTEKAVIADAAGMARVLFSPGIRLRGTVAVVDDAAELETAVREAFSRSDIVFLCGGSGSGGGAAAKLPGRSPVPAGTASGFFPEGGGRILVALPEPPEQLRPAPRLREAGRVPVCHELRFCGIGKPELERRIAGLAPEACGLTVAPYAEPGEVTVRVTAAAPTEEEAERRTEAVRAVLKTDLADFFCGEDVPDLQTAVVECLKERGLTVATAESCTGGLVSELLTGVPGASEVFPGGVVVYSNAMKEVLGVRAETLRRFGAVSSETAAEMAEAVRRVTGAGIGVSVTGNAGPSASEGKPVGLVYVGIAGGGPSRAEVLRVRRNAGDGGRELIRRLAASRALHLVLRTARRTN